VYTRLQSTAVDEVRPALQPTPRSHLGPKVPSPMVTLGLVVPSRRPPTDHRTVTHVPKQDEISDGAASMRQAVIQADRAGVLSANETVEDIATSDLKYVMCNFYLASIVSRTRTPDPAARAPIATEASDALEAFLTMCETHELLTEQARAVRERQKQGGTPDPATARADKVAGFKRERAIRARLEELDAERRRRAEEALLNADWDDEDPDASPEDEESDRERWLLVIEDSIGKALDDVPHLAQELEMIGRREELQAQRPGPRGGVNAPGRGVYTLLPDGSVNPGFNDGSIGGEGSMGGGLPPGVPRELMERLGKMYGTGVAGGATRSVEQIRSEVFRPSHILPTMTVEQAGEIEYAEMRERELRSAENAARAAREEAEMTEEERETRDLAKARSWDEFKDDNPFGHGNSKLRPCG